MNDTYKSNDIRKLSECRELSDFNNKNDISTDKIQEKYIQKKIFSMWWVWKTIPIVTLTLKPAAE